MGYTKLYEGIIQSSVMAEDPVTFKVWIAILASTGPDAIARISSTFLAAACYLPVAKVDKALATLESPDPRSRSLNDDGKRITRVDGGFFVINYEKYRNPQEGDPGSPGAIRTRRWREKKNQNVTDSPVVTNGDVGDVTESSPASASVLNSGILLTLKEDIRYLWCEFARRHGLTEIKNIPKGSKRDRTLNARIEDKDFDFKALLAKVEESPFLLGKKTDFKATFDWILAPSNYQKIIEGNYRGTTPFDGPREWLKKQEEKDHGND